MNNLPIIIGLLVAFSILACKGSEPEVLPGVQDPARCKQVDLGEASDLMEKNSIDDDRIALISGIADPRALVWRDEKDGNTYYITRVMGTEQRLFYFKQIKGQKKPGIATEFRGHLIRWDKLRQSRFNSVSSALKDQYGIHIKPESTYLINADGKPGGCP